MLQTRYRVNLHVYFRKPGDGSVVYDPLHLGFWGQEQMARDVIAGLDLRCLAYHYVSHRRGDEALVPMGRVVAVVGPLVQDEKERIVSNGPDVEVREETYSPPPMALAA